MRRQQLDDWKSGDVMRDGDGHLWERMGSGWGDDKGVVSFAYPSLPWTRLIPVAASDHFTEMDDPYDRKPGIPRTHRHGKPTTPADQPLLDDGQPGHP